MSKKQSKLSGIAATVGAVALMASMAVPAFASSANWATIFPAFRGVEYNIAAGNISASSAGTYSVWLDSVDAGESCVHMGNKSKQK